MGNQFANGIGGALSLALIAFSTVFLVLGGLTLIIFCVQYLAAIGEGGRKKTPPSGGAPASKAPAVAPAAPAPREQARAGSAEGNRLAAVISAAILASTGRAVRIKSITPAGRPHGTMGGGWRASALLENSQGMVRDPWSRR